MQRALVFPFRIALLKLNSQEAATLMASGSYAEALPVAMGAVKEGQDIFKPQPDLRLFPLFLLGAQVHLKSLSASSHVTALFVLTEVSHRNQSHSDISHTGDIILFGLDK